MVMQPICEPVELPLGTTALIAQVHHPGTAPPVARLLHFHDVAEIVLFGEARGRFVCADASYAITPGCAVFAPTMHYHDFHFEPGAKSWTLIQFDPYLVERLSQSGAVMGVGKPFCVELDSASANRLAMLAGWLADTARADGADPLIEHVIGLILMAISRLPAASGERIDEGGTQLARFLPVVERLRASPGARLTLGEAAALCHVSPAYFSRRFAALFGCGFADYVTSYRLHVASRRIATTATPFSTIAYNLGFSSPSHFTARFRQRFGLSPRDYRDRVRDLKRS